MFQNPTSATPYTTSEALLGLREDDVRRKGEQKGTVRKVGKSWYIQFFAWRADETGNLKYARTARKVEGQFRTEKQALAAGYEQHVKAANAVTKVPQGLATVEQFYELRFRPDHVDMLKKSGRQHYKTEWKNHVQPTLGAVALRDVSPQMVQVLLSAKLNAGLAPQTVAHVRNVISAIFEHAKTLRFYEGELPTRGVKIPEIIPASRGALTWEQVQMLAGAMPARHRPLIIVLSQTGMRIGEACGLLWRNVNLSDDWKIINGEALPPNSILVCDSWTRNERTTLKNPRLWRKVPMTAECWVAFMQQWESSKFRGEDQPVFASRIGTPLDAHNVSQRSLKTAARRIGIPWVSFHHLRHTTATLADKAGLSVAEKQAILGHATAGMTLHYTHPEIERLRQGMEQMSTGRVQ